MNGVCANGAPGDLAWPASLARLALLDTAIRQTHDAIVITTADLAPPGPTIVFVNPAFCAMTGYAPDELLGRSPRLLQGPETARAVLDDLRGALAAARAWVGEAVNYRKDGRAYRVEWQIAPVWAGTAGGDAPANGTAESATAGTGDEGPVTHFIAVQNDVTVRRLLEARARTTGTLEALGRLAGGVAHDFNNLLTVIAGGTELALGVLAADHPARADLADVQAAVRRATGLTRQLLAFGRRQVVAPAPLDPGAAVRALAPMLRRQAGPGTELVLAVAGDAGAVRVDAGQFDQVLVNLVANARDAMPGGGLLTITTAAAGLPDDPTEAETDGTAGDAVRSGLSVSGRARDGASPPGMTAEGAAAWAASADDPLGRSARTSAPPEGAPAPPGVASEHAGAARGATGHGAPYVRVSVADTGHGMDAATRARLFEPFFTTKPVGQGTGLGLATVYGIVTQHGGALRVWSAPGRGTTVEVYLPRAAGAAGAAADAAAGETGDVRLGAPAPAASGTETLLLVEDERLVRTAVTRLLALRGYTVLAARHGADALRLYAAHGGAAGRVALVLTDVAMPAMDGPTLVGRLRALRPDQKVVYMSGYAGVVPGETSGGTFPDAGPRLAADAHTAVVEKPFDAEILARVVRDLLDRPTATTAAPEFIARPGI